MNPLVEWLFKTPNIFSLSTNKEISDRLFETLFRFLSSCEDISISLTRELFKVNFYLYMFNNVYPTQTIDYDDEDYISTKYTSDIVDTFLEMRDISDSYGTNLISNKTSDSLLYFITSNCYVIDDTDLMDVDEYHDKEYQEKEYSEEYD